MKVRAINGYKIWKASTLEGKKKLIIEYLIDGESFTRSVYEDDGIDEEKIQRLKEYLDDQTDTNQRAELLCSTVSMVTILHDVNEIIIN